MRALPVFMEKEPLGVAKTLVKDYAVTVKRSGKEVCTKTVSGNYQRLNVISFPEGTEGDEVEVRITSTNGAADATVFEVRIY